MHHPPPPTNPPSPQTPKPQPHPTPPKGIKYADIQQGSGNQPQVGDLVMCDLVLTLEDGKTVLDTREAGTPIAFQVGITNPRELWLGWVRWGGWVGGWGGMGGGWGGWD